MTAWSQNVSLRQPIYFLRFLGLSNVEPQAFVAVVQLLHEGNGKRVNADVSVDPIPDLHKALQSQDNTSQLLLHPLEEEVVHMSQIQPIERLLEQLDLVGSHMYTSEQCQRRRPENCSHERTTPL